MDRKKADRLIVKLFGNQLTEAESKWLERWLESEENLSYFNEVVKFNGFLNRQRHFDYHKSFMEVLAQIKRERRRHFYNQVLKYAAVLVVLLGVGYLWMKTTEDFEQKSEITIVAPNEIYPGSSKAILTLGDKTQIHLQEGKVFENPNMVSEGNELVYFTPGSESKENAGEIAYNELMVPLGGQFSITLTDGTRVWLNSGSKIRYPEKFVSGKTREVELVYGEAYLEVSPSEKHGGTGFQVQIDELKTQVLGTEFNIKAYPDEKEIQTTLVEGSVALEKGEEKLILKPWERATLDKNTEVFAVETVDSFDDLLWKEGIFSFKHKPLKEIMKVLERWYDMEVEFENPAIQEVRFTGNLTKKRSIEEIMNIMYLTNNINYDIDGKTLILK